MLAYLPEGKPRFFRCSNGRGLALSPQLPQQRAWHLAEAARVARGEDVLPRILLGAIRVRQFCPKENGEFSQENPGKWMKMVDFTKKNDDFGKIHQGTWKIYQRFKMKDDGIV